MSDFQNVEEFRVKDITKRAWGALLTPVTFLAVVAALIFWFLIHALLGAFLDEGPALTWLPRLAAALLFVAMTGSFWFMQKLALQRAVLGMSPDGIVLLDGGTRRVMRWEHMVKADFIVLMRGIETDHGGSSARAGQAAGKGLNRAVQAISGMFGIVGYGTIEPQNPNNPVTQKQIAQNTGVWGTDDAGRPYLGLTPGVIDAKWYDGRMGDWLRHYRLDIAESYEKASKFQK